MTYKKFLLTAQAVVVTLAGCSSPEQPAFLPPDWTPPGEARISIVASPQQVVRGGYALLTWSVENATNCQAIGGWSGSLANSGEMRVGPVRDETDYRLRCFDAGTGRWIESASRVGVRRAAYSLTFIPQVDVASGFSNIQPAAINNLGQVTGKGRLNEEEERAFLYTAGSFTDVGGPVGAWTIGNDVNDSGDVTGFLSVGYSRAFIAGGGSFLDLGVVLGESVGMAINNRGWIAGALRANGFPQRAYRYDGNEITIIGTFGGSNSEALGINDAGDVIGAAHTSDGRLHAFLVQQDQMIDLNPEGIVDSYALDINDNGDVLVQGYKDFEQLNWVYRNGNYVDVDVGTEAVVNGIRRKVQGVQASAMNNLGVVVGDFIPDSGVFCCSFVWDGPFRVQALSDMIDPELGCEVWGASDINDKGEILAAVFCEGGSLPDFTQAFVLLSPTN